MKKNILLAGALVMILPAMIFTTSCAKKKMQTESVSTIQPEIQKAPDSSAEEAEQARLIEEERLREERLREERLRAEVAAREAAGKAFVTENIHFDFNSSILSEQAQRTLNSKADYLRNNSGVKVTVEGHCDERGTESYNISLGQKRASNVKKYLVNLGINTNRLATISYGEERPIAIGKNETSWAKNRRAQFVIN
jgi:peptidoglycan-associated lipoprotein